MKYTKVTKKDNICNICQNEIALSWDHVPPKGGIDLSSLEVRNYVTTNFCPNSIERDILQNGIKYKTICKKCNSQLGSLYDTTFNQFMKDVYIFAKSDLYIPNILNIKTSPTNIIKSLLGHLLATKIDYYNGELDIITREYLTNENAVLPANVHIYCWFYPYNCTIIYNDICQLDRFVMKIYHYSVIKTFPLAFAISLDCQLDDLLIDSTEITKYNFNQEDKMITIPIKIIPIKKWDYPEALKYSRGVLIKQKSNDIFATKRKEQK